MSLVVFASARSAPGVTTLSVAVAAWFDRGVLVEADPDGGVLAVRHRLGRDPGLVTLAAGHLTPTESLLDHAQRLPGGLPVVVAPESAERSTHLWRTAGGALVRTLAAEGNLDVVVDAGRLSPSSPALALVPHAALTVVVARPNAEQLLAAADRVRALSAMTDRVTIALVGDGPYTSRDVADELGCEVVGTVAHDERAAAALTSGSGGRSFVRSPLIRSARALAEEIATGTGISSAPAARVSPDRFEEAKA